MTETKADLLPVSKVRKDDLYGAFRRLLNRVERVLEDAERQPADLHAHLEGLRAAHKQAAAVLTPTGGEVQFEPVTKRAGDIAPGDQVFLWALAIGLPFVLTGLFKLLAAVF